MNKVGIFCGALKIKLNLASTCWPQFLPLILTVVMLSSAHAGERIETLYADGRPAGLYSVVAQFKPEVCERILNSLNKPFSVDRLHISDYPGFTEEADLFLASDLQPPWSVEVVDRADTADTELERLDSASANVGARTVTLFRRSFSVPDGNDGGLLPVNSLTISNMRPPVVPAGQRVDPRVFKNIKGKELWFDGDKLAANGPVNVAKPSRPRSVDSYYLLNVVIVEGETFILAINALEAEVEAPKATDGSVILYVLQLVSPTNIRLACRFVGK